MENKKFKLCAIILLSLGLTGLKAQETIPATGGDASGSGGTVSYSIGQMFYITNAGTTGSVAHGVQQPYEISVISGIYETKGINIECTAYPNPTNDFLTLKIDDFENENLFYQLFDIKGNLIEMKKIKDNETNIKVEMLVPASYFLKILKKNKEIKTFKIIKN